MIKSIIIKYLILVSSIKMPAFIVFCFVLLMSCGDAKQDTSKIKESQKKAPSIIFIFTDDQTYDAVHALGNKDIVTPNMDRLVEQGTTFTHAYNMGSWAGAVCLASRAMIISGRSVWDAQRETQKWKKGEDTLESWPAYMKKAGYQTFMSGKWHVDIKPSAIFSQVGTVRGGMPKDAWNHALMVEKFKALKQDKIGELEDIMPIGYNRPLSRADSSWSPTDKKFGGFWEGGKHWSEALKDEAIDFLKNRDKEKPSFLYLAFSAPHDPRQAPQEYQDLYQIDSINLPDNWAPDYPFHEIIGNGPSLRDEALAPFPRTPYATRVHLKEYYASISYLDYQIGEILDFIEADSTLNDAYIMFTADHGLAMGSHGLFGKQNLYDHTLRVPLVLVGPDIPKNKKKKQDVYLQDVMATALDLANIKRPENLFFNSLKPIATGEKVKGNYNEIYGAHRDFQRGIRVDGFKLIVYPKAKEILLYDLKNDPSEINNLAKDPQNKERIESLFNQLKKLQIKMNDTLQLNKTDYHVFQ